jgi:hypothetical protein
MARSRRRKEGSLAAIDFARGMLCSAWIEDGFSTEEASADAVVLMLNPCYALPALLLRCHQSVNR